MINRSNMPTASKVSNESIDSNYLFRKKQKTAVIILAVSLTLTLVVVILFLSTPKSLVPSSKAAEVPFSVYSPKSSPAGYRFVKERVKFSSSTFSYIFEKDDGSNDLTVTIQPKPSKFNMSSMSEGGSINSISTKNGVLYNLSASGNSQYLLDTGESLVFFRSNSSIDNATMTSLADSLVKIN